MAPMNAAAAWQQVLGSVRRTADGFKTLWAGRMVRGVGVFAGVHVSIRAKILIAMVVVIVLMGASNAFLVLQVMNYSRQYDAIINNVTTANSISGNIKTDIDTEMWKIVSGKIDFAAGRQYQILSEVDAKLTQAMANTDSPRGQIKLEGVRRTIRTLTEYVDLMAVQIRNHSTAAENEQLLEKIRFATSVVEEVVQDYALFEVHRTEGQYQTMREAVARWEAFSILLMATAVLFSLVATWYLSRSIYIPIKKLHNVTTTLTKDDLQALVTHANVDEITELGLSFNILVGKIRDLLAAKIKEQDELKKAELKALQAQINPHFLYNTLDTIIWMAEANKKDQVVELVSALSQFFRISLSKGRDWITIADEVEQTRSYLTIQKMRYQKILDFRIELDADAAANTILKLTLQPLVENALYHGIKHKRGGGTIRVRARMRNPAEIQIDVEDDGIGFAPEKLTRLQSELANDDGESPMDSGFGIGNVHRRLKLYYGRQYGLSIRSTHYTGTCVTLIIPAQVQVETAKAELPGRTAWPEPAGSPWRGSEA
ncbi:MAG: sensor histidine kinase [Anaerolineales bacterium]|nr:sensor histidine kinase [Anaerolineales bacterium]